MQAGGEAGAEVEQVERGGRRLVSLPVSAFSILVLEQGLVSL